MTDVGCGRRTARGADPVKALVRDSFSRAAARYDALATLQRTVAEHVFGYLRVNPIRPATVLDLGAGTGYCLRRLGAVFPQAQLIAVDLAEGMLHQARQSAAAGRPVWLVNGDAERLPLADGTSDLVVSNLALQWCPDLPAALRECARVLAPGGCLAFTTFGSETLCELRQAWRAVDAYSHVNRFATGSAVTDALSRAGLHPVRLVSELRVLAYPDVFTLMRELKGLGAHNVTGDRRRALTGKRRLAAMVAAYRSSDAGPARGVPATFEVLFGVARRSE